MSARRGGLARPAYDLCAHVCGVCVGWGEPQLDDDGDDDAMGVFVVPRRPTVVWSSKTCPYADPRDNG